MTAARFEYLDFVNQKDRADELTAVRIAAYDQGRADGRSEVLNERQEVVEARGFRDAFAFLLGLVTAGTTAFLLSL